MRGFFSDDAWKALGNAVSKGGFGVPEAFMPKQKEFIRAAQAAGCKLGTGTDLVVPWLPPGVSLWREMEIFAEAGLSPMDVLEAATWNGIFSVGETDMRGTIEPGKLADFVVLDGDPLSDIRNVRHVYRVVKNGVVYNPAQLLNGMGGKLN
jgi:imidazolonepropionase-like amidohydrolase